MSIINAFTWVTAAAIYSFETLLDVFTTDIAKTFTQRINGTSAYYANAMLKWQYGDDLIINDEQLWMVFRLALLWAKISENINVRNN